MIVGEPNLYIRLKGMLHVESTKDILKHLMEEEQKIRERAQDLGVELEPRPPEEVAAPFRAKKEIPRTELTEKEIGSLFAETRDILDIYTTDYISEHYDEAQNLYHVLLEKPFSPDTLIGSRVAQNIHELKTRIDAVQEKKSPTRPLEEFVPDVKRLFDTLDTYESSEAKRKYADLLRREQTLPRNTDQHLETEIQEYLTEIGKQLQRKDKKSSEEVGEELLEEISRLIGSRNYDPEGYNRLAKKFQTVANDIPEDLQLKIRDRIRECFAKMKDIEEKQQKSEQEREIRTKKFYWDAFASEVEQLKTSLEDANPGEFFRLYDIYNQILDSLEDADITQVPLNQIERVKSLLEQCYYVLEELRTHA